MEPLPYDTAAGGVRNRWRAVEDALPYDPAAGGIGCVGDGALDVPSKSVHDGSKPPPFSLQIHLKNVKILHKTPLFLPAFRGVAAGCFCTPQYLVVIRRKTAETLGISGFSPLFSVF